MEAHRTRSPWLRSGRTTHRRRRPRPRECTLGGTTGLTEGCSGHNQPLCCGAGKQSRQHTQQRVAGHTTSTTRNALTHMPTCTAWMCGTQRRTLCAVQHQLTPMNEIRAIFFLTSKDKDHVVVISPHVPLPVPSERRTSVAELLTI